MKLAIYVRTVILYSCRALNLLLKKKHTHTNAVMKLDYVISPFSENCLLLFVTGVRSTQNGITALIYQFTARKRSLCKFEKFGRSIVGSKFGRICKTRFNVD